MTHMCAHGADLEIGRIIKQTQLQQDLFN